jgi:hypothetical protein
VQLEFETQQYEQPILVCEESPLDMLFISQEIADLSGKQARSIRLTLDIKVAWNAIID